MDAVAHHPAWPSSTGEMAARIRAFDWSRTQLGSVDRWPQSLRTTMDTVLAMPGPATILWGPEHVQLYNDAYIAIAKDRHPTLLGCSAREGWPDAYETVIAPLLEAAAAGRATQLTGFRVALLTQDGGHEERIFDTAWSPIRDEAGVVAGVLQTLVEITAQIRVAQQLRDSEERYRAFVTTCSDVVYRMSPDWTEMCELAGRGILTDTEGPSRTWLARYIHPDDQPKMTVAIREAIRTKDLFELEHRVRRSNGGFGWTLSRAVPLLNADGAIREWVGTASDVTERKQIDIALRESEARHRALIEGVPQLVWRAVGGGAWTWASPQWTAYTGQSDAESRGLGWLDLVHPHDRETALARWQSAEDTGSFETEYRLRHQADGCHRWFQTRATPVRDEDGHIVEWLGTSTEIDALRQMQERQAVMVTELQHRTRNLLGVVRSIAQQTMAQTGPGERFKEQFNDRLSALSRVQGLLSRSDEEPITLRVLIEMELAALGAGALRDRVVLEGPAVRLRKATVQTFALALHELATNACKYGAFTSEHGRLTVRWRIHHAEGEGPRLFVEWLEDGISPPSRERGSATRRGYGRDLIDRALPYALKAKTSYALGDTTLCCTIDLPLAHTAQDGGPS